MADELIGLLPRGRRAARDPPLLLALARELARRPSAAGPAVRDDAQPRRAHPGQLPVLHDDRAHAAGHRDHQVGLQGIGRRDAGSRAPAAPRGAPRRCSTPRTRLRPTRGWAATRTASPPGSCPTRTPKANSPSTKHDRRRRYHVRRGHRRRLRSVRHGPDRTRRPDHRGATRSLARRSAEPGSLAGLQRVAAPAAQGRAGRARARQRARRAGRRATSRCAPPSRPTARSC